MKAATWIRNALAGFWRVVSGNGQKPRLRHILGEQVRMTYETERGPRTIYGRLVATTLYVEHDFPGTHEEIFVESCRQHGWGRA